jgi:F-type H+-transporting ATPase subunit gamma
MARGEILTKIRSIGKTKKITKAMEMVAASKMRKTQERMAQSKPYSQQLYRVAMQIAWANTEYHHPFLHKRDIKKIGVILIGTDRGLCGGLNANLFRHFAKQAQSWQDNGKKLVFATIGRKSKAFARRLGVDIKASKENIGDAPKLHDLIGVMKVMIDAYYEGEIDALYLVYNDFVNTMIQQPTVSQLIPLPKTEEDKKQLGHRWDYIYEPEAKSLLDAVFDRYIEFLIYHAVVENIACEQAAKMIAMKNATDNAEGLIKEFQLAYNKARQAAITQELAEIVGGAGAL